MPLSEFHRVTTKRKPESNQPKMHNYSSDVSSFMPDHEFAELLWENDQIVINKKSSFPTPFPSLKVLGRESRDDADTPKIGLFGAMDSTVNATFLSEVVPSVNIDLHAQDDEIAPWMNYSVEDTLCSDFLSELSGINPNSLPNDRNNGSGVKDFHNVENEQSDKGFKEGKASQFFQSPQQYHTSNPNSKQKLADFSVRGNIGSSNPQGQFQKQELLSASKHSQRGGGVASMNFSHFARPVARMKANIEHNDRWKSKEALLPAAATTNPVDSTSTGVRGNASMDLANKELGSVAKPRCVSVKKPDAFVLEGAFRNNQHCIGTAKKNSATEVNRHNSSVAATVALGSQETEKGPEPTVASSVCSVSSAGDGPNDLMHREKRKNREADESEYLSEDLEDDSIGEKKLTTTRVGTSTKRSRAAEVHNLSERRRRDRINEKMRALQELIPNCNKVDKASMLDEAIEYLKTLQLQVQMMSMGTGFCMPHLMLPPAMAHFPPMSLGMGYGMGMFDMNGSQGCPLIPVPQIHAPQYPCTSLPRPTGLPMFGIPGHGQGHPVPMPCAQIFSPLPGIVAKGNAKSEVSNTTTHSIPVSDTGVPSSSKDQQQLQQNMNLEAVQKANISESQVAK